MNGSTEAGDIYFFCDQCSEHRLSRRHTVTLTCYGVEIVKDVCSYCGVEQEIELIGRKQIETYRIRDNGYKTGGNKAK